VVNIRYINSSLRICLYYAFYHDISTFQLVKFKTHDKISKEKCKFPDAMYLSIEVIMSYSSIKNK